MPTNALRMVDQPAALTGSALLPSVRGELLLRLNRYEETLRELSLTAPGRQKR